MAFCTNCGSQEADVVGPLDYSIQGDNLQIARLRLKPGQEVYADAGRMVYKTANVQWETRMTGNSPGEEFMGAESSARATDTLARSPPKLL